MTSFVPPEIQWFDTPIKVECRGKLGLILGLVWGGEFYAVDFGDGDIKYLRGDGEAELKENSVQ
jgi:hypothetical protein